MTSTMDLNTFTAMVSSVVSRLTTATQRESACDSTWHLSGAGPATHLNATLAAHLLGVEHRAGHRVVCQLAGAGQQRHRARKQILIVCLALKVSDDDVGKQSP